MKTEIRAEFYDRLFKILVPILIAIAGWYMKSQAADISSLTVAMNQSVIQQRELFIKLENTEKNADKHRNKSDQIAELTSKRVNILELKVERMDEKLQRISKDYK